MRRRRRPPPSAELLPEVQGSSAFPPISGDPTPADAVAIQRGPNPKTELSFGSELIGPADVGTSRRNGEGHTSLDRLGRNRVGHQLAFDVLLHLVNSLLQARPQRQPKHLLGRDGIERGDLLDRGGHRERRDDRTRQGMLGSLGRRIGRARSEA